MPQLEIPEGTSYPFMQSFRDMLPDWSLRVLSLVCCFMIGFFLITLNNYYAIIRRRASVQTSIFLLFVSVCPVLHMFYPTDIGIILVLFSIYNLFKCYQQQKPTGYVFNAFVFLGLGSLLFTPLLWFVPVFILGVGIINKIDFKNFIAGILGCSLPYWFLWGYAYYVGDMEIFSQPFRDLWTPPTFGMSIVQWIGWAYFLIIYLVSSVYCFTSKHKDKIRTRAYLRFIILLLFAIFAYILLYPSFSAASMFLLLLTGLSILTAHFFVLTNSKASNLFFIGALIGLVLLFIINIWMPL